MLTQFYIGGIVLGSILLIVYYICYTNMILNLHKQLESVQKGQNECLKDPMEIETVRYQMKYLYKNKSFSNTIMGFGIPLIIISCLIILFGLYIQYVKGYNQISIFPGLILLLFAVSIIATFKRENFTEDRVLTEYDKKYISMKDKLQLIIDAKDYTDVSSLPEQILNSLMQRFREYNYLHQVVKMPLYTNYEALDVLKNQLTDPYDGSILVEELMKYLKFNTDSTRTVKGRDADGNIAELPLYLTDIDLLRPRDTRTPFENDLIGTNTYNPYESLKSSLKAHTTLIIIWTILLSYLLFHLLYRAYGNEGRFTTVFTLLMIAFVIVILTRVYISDFY